MGPSDGERAQWSTPVGNDTLEHLAPSSPLGKDALASFLDAGCRSNPSLVASMYFPFPCMRLLFSVEEGTKIAGTKHSRGTHALEVEGKHSGSRPTLPAFEKCLEASFGQIQLQELECCHDSCSQFMLMVGGS